MNKIEFHQLIDNVVSHLYTIAKRDPEIITSCKTGDDFELVVVNALGAILHNTGIRANIHHTPGSHVFPDIILECASGEKYGIEAKSSSMSKSKGWKINGNSVMGSTRDDSVIETYIIFGKTAKTTLEFKARNYEDCVANVVVTHSPRYLIDMELPDGETFFQKSGIEYKKIITSSNPIGLITSYFQSEGQKAWWLSESSPAAVRMFNDIPVKEQLECFGYGLAHFPELFERNSTKYKRLAMWLAVDKSIVSPSLRDDFSAGGQVNLQINNVSYRNLPQIFKRLIEYKPNLLSELDSAEAESLCNDWNCPYKQMVTLEDKVRSWIKVAVNHVNLNQLPPEVNPLDLFFDIFHEYRKNY